MLRRGPGLAVALAFVVLAFSTNSLVTRFVVERDLLDPGLLSSFRFLAGAVVLLALALAGRHALRVERRHLFAAAWLGAYAFLISYGYRFIPAAAGTFVFYAAVLVTLTASERRMPSPRRLGGAALALVGLGVLAASKLDQVRPVGVLLLAGTGIAWGLYTAAGRGKRDALAFSAVNFGLLGGALVVPTAIDLVAAAPHVTMQGVLLAIAMGAGTTALAYVVWYACQEHITASQAGLLQLAIPIVTALAAVMLLGEAWSAKLAFAGALVLGGIALGTL